MDNDVTTSAGSIEFRKVSNRCAEDNQRLRAQGMRPVENWLPDVKSQKFVAEALRNARLACRSAEEVEIQSFIDSVFVWPDDAYSQ